MATRWRSTSKTSRLAPRVADQLGVKRRLALVRVWQFDFTRQSGLPVAVVENEITSLRAARASLFHLGVSEGRFGLAMQEQRHPFCRVRRKRPFG